MIDKGQWWELSAMGFIVTTEWQDLSLTSNPKAGKNYKIMIKMLIRRFQTALGAFCI